MKNLFLQNLKNINININILYLKLKWIYQLAILFYFLEMN
jgi:hypothetical protein